MSSHYDYDCVCVVLSDSLQYARQSFTVQKKNQAKKVRLASTLCTTGFVGTYCRALPTGWQTAVEGRSQQKSK